jgi:hypothetical protein
MARFITGIVLAAPLMENKNNNQNSPKKWIEEEVDKCCQALWYAYPGHLSDSEQTIIRNNLEIIIREVARDLARKLRPDIFDIRVHLSREATEEELLELGNDICLQAYDRKVKDLGLAEMDSPPTQQVP